MKRILAALALVLALVVPVNAELQGQTVSANSTSQTITIGYSTLTVVNEVEVLATGTLRVEADVFLRVAGSMLNVQGTQPFDGLAGAVQLTASPTPQISAAQEASWQERES